MTRWWKRTDTWWLSARELFNYNVISDFFLLQKSMINSIESHRTEFGCWHNQMWRDNFLCKFWRKLVITNYDVWAYENTKADVVSCNADLIEDFEQFHLHIFILMHSWMFPYKWTDDLLQLHPMTRIFFLYLRLINMAIVQKENNFLHNESRANSPIFFH